MTTTAQKQPTKETTTAFKNEPFVDFSQVANQDAMARAIAEVKAASGREYPLHIDGKHVVTGEWMVSTNPAKPEHVVGRFAKATTEHADLAMQAALEAFEKWKRVSPQERADYIFKAADLMRQRRLVLAAWLVLEIGKSWEEANRELSLAIDYSQWYAHEMLRLGAPPPLPKVTGEDNTLSYIPLGVGIIIPPWNLGFAMVVGMTTAAVAAGNAVIVNPSSKALGCAYQLAAILEEVGLPRGVFNYVAGPGSVVSEYLVGHPKTRFIAFSGSKEIGLRVMNLAAKIAPGQIWIKRVSASLGGKGSIIVDSSADLDAAADGIVYSAFGYQGQKCGACTRVIAVQDTYQAILEKVIERTGKLVIGPPEQRQNDFGPIISDQAVQRLIKYIDIGKQEGRLVAGGNRHETPEQGYYVEPTIIADVAPDARVALEEIFGPLLAFIKADSFDEALRIGNNTEFAETSGVYSRTREHMQQASADLFCGNLFFNQKCSVARVGSIPFGGFNMSGTGAKFGGSDYLMEFLQTKVFSERL